MAGFVGHLRARGQDGLAALLVARPDLAAPPPASLRALAARAATRASLERALADVDAAVLAVLEAVLGLDGTTAHPDGPAPATVAAAVGGDVDAALAQAADLALVWPEGDTVRPAPGLGEVLGPYPAGLGPSLVSALARRSPAALARLAEDVGAADASVPAVAAAVTDAASSGRLLAAAPPGARAVLDALTWGPPVGRSPAAEGDTPARTAVEWLLRHGLLAVGDPQHVVLPRDVALALRGGRTHRGLPARPDPAGLPVPAATVDAESARHAEELVRLVAALVEEWGRQPPAALRSGGLGARELRRLATRWGADDATAALVVEVAGAAGLVADDGEEQPALVPTHAADDWLARPLPARWSHLARAWLDTERTAWLVGTRDERGALRAALDPELRRPWAPRLRRSVLDVLTARPGAAPSADEVHAVLAWRAPRSAPPLHAVEAVLAEASTLGVTGAGAAAPAGRALLAVDPAVDAPATPDDDAPADALAAQLPVAVDEVLLGGDLTGIVPGRPSEELAALLDAAAVVESRGAATTVRFTDVSVRSALDAGATAESLLADLSRHARGGVPQPLEYLVLDVARRHGRVRVGAASSYLRCEDPALLAGLVEDRALRGLGLVRLPPTAMAAQVGVPALLAALRERGLAPVAEDASGRVVDLASGPRRARGPARRRPAAAPDPGAAEAARQRRLHRLAGQLLTTAPASDLAAPDGDAVGDPDRGGGTGTADPLVALGLLREAAAEGREVYLEIVGGDGTPARRRVRPLRVDGGRVRAVDAERESELTVAVHRIARVIPT